MRWVRTTQVLVSLFKVAGGDPDSNGHYLLHVSNITSIFVPYKLSQLEVVLDEDEQNPRPSPARRLTSTVDSDAQVVCVKFKHCQPTLNMVRCPSEPQSDYPFPPVVLIMYSLRFPDKERGGIFFYAVPP